MTRASVTGWKLDRGEREALLRDHPPHYAEAVADHVTLEVGGATLPSEVDAAIVGRADDGEGVEAMVVDDRRDQRPPRRLDFSHHLVARAGPAGDRKQ